MKQLRSGGFMMLEIIIATSIIVVFLLVAMSVAAKAIAFSRQSLHVSQAAFLLEEGAEAVRINRDNAWTNISGLTPGTNYYLNFSGGSWIFQQSAPSPSQTDNFTRTVVVSNVSRDATTGDIALFGNNDSGTKLVIVTVAWTERGQTLTKTLKFYISDIFS